MATKSRLKMLSQSSQDSSLGTPSNLTPATRKKKSELLANSPLSSPMLDHLINDDKSEKKRRLQARLSTNAQNHLGSPASESQNKTLGSTMSGWNTSQVTEHLHNCIQMSRDNKITVRNAFSLHLIDTMKEMIKKEKETNFQMAGSSIEAGAKIYASRVDAIHIQAFQVLDQVSQLDKDGDRSAGDQPQGDSSHDDGPEAKKKTKKKKKVIETDLKKINILDVEQSYEIDPLLQKLSKEGDSSFGGLLLDSLKCSYDKGGVMLDVLSRTDPPADHNLSDRPFTECESLNLALLDRQICPTFCQYEFNSGDKHPIFAVLDNRDDELRFDPNRNMAAQNDGDDFNGAVEDFADGSFGADAMDAAAMDVDDKTDGFVDYISKSTATHTLTSCVTAESIYNSMLSLVSDAGGEYSFFGGMKNMWAGPGYWKARRPGALGTKRSGDDLRSSVKSKKTALERFVIDFEADIDFKKKFKKTRASTCVTKKTLERYKSQQTKLDLPEVSHYKSKQLLCLFSRPTVYVLVQNPSETAVDDESMNMSQPYDYFNKNDVDNFCPNLSEGMADDNDDFQTSLLSGQPTVLDFDETLVSQPALVERINLEYAKRPKKIDFKRLKRNMWNILTDCPNGKENVEQSFADSVEKCVKRSGMPFTDLYSKLGVLCPSKEAKDLSPPIAFVALLHMCNEKNLLLKAVDSFVDLAIYEGEK